MPSNNSGNGRIDTVVLRWDSTQKTVRLAYVSGTPSSSPVAPTLRNTDALKNIALANITVDNQFSTIASSKITNLDILGGTRSPSSLVISRLGSGTASATNALYGDGEWKDVLSYSTETTWDNGSPLTPWRIYDSGVAPPSGAQIGFIEPTHGSSTHARYSHSSFFVSTFNALPAGGADGDTTTNTALNTPDHIDLFIHGIAHGEQQTWIKKLANNNIGYISRGTDPDETGFKIIWL